MGSLINSSSMRSILIVACVVLAVSAQRPGGFGGRPGGLPGKLKPKCADGGRPTCTCANGDVIDRPRPNPCGDNTRPNCVCADGSSPTRGSPCTGGPPKCADGGALSCADGTSLGFLANFIG